MKEPMIMNASKTFIAVADITFYPYIAAFLMNA